jgi:hypothetical protein
MSTYAELKDAVARTVQDPGNKTFTPAMVADIIQAAWAEIGRVAPQRFREDIDLVPDAMSYVLRAPGAELDVTGDEATDIITTDEAHGFAADTSVRFSALTGGSGLVVGLPYFVSATNLGATTLSVSATQGGAIVNFTTAITAGTLQRTGFDTAVPEVELTRVELWDMTSTPGTPVKMLAPADGEYINFSDVGWKVWGGVLELPRWVPQYVLGSEEDYLLRVWGYSPWRPLVADTDVSPLSHELEQALLSYARVEALRRLNSSRELFTQWQTRSGNTDVSPAGLMNALNIALDDWRRRSRAIAVLREAPG